MPSTCGKYKEIQVNGWREGNCNPTFSLLFSMDYKKPVPAKAMDRRIGGRSVGSKAQQQIWCGVAAAAALQAMIDGHGVECRAPDRDR